MSSDDQDTDSIRTHSPPPASGSVTTTSPFNSIDADLILRSSDEVEFQIHRYAMTMASPVFQNVLSLPQPADPLNGPPVVDLPEDSRTLYTILRICYPVLDPKIDTIELARSVLDAALKYDMVVVVDYCKRALRSLAKSQPLRVYAIACTIGAETTARLAVREIVAHAPDNILGQETGAYAKWLEGLSNQRVAEFEDMSAGCYFRLMLYCRSSRPELFSFCHGERISTASPEACGNASSEEVLRTAPFPFDNPAAGVIILTKDKMQFHVFESILILASPVFKEMLLTNSNSEQRTLEVDDDSDTIRCILLFCYPFGIPETVAIEVIPAVLRAADKYQVERAKWFLRKQWEMFASEPLRAYLLAAAIGWKEEAGIAARALLEFSTRDLQDRYVQELERASANSYIRLLEYREKCIEVTCSRTASCRKWLTTRDPRLEHILGCFVCYCNDKASYKRGRGVCSWIVYYTNIVSNSFKDPSQSMPAMFSPRFFSSTTCFRACQSHASEASLLHAAFADELNATIDEVSNTFFPQPL